MEVVSIGTPALWIGFTVLVLGLLALDLGVFHRDAHEVSFREALGKYSEALLCSTYWDETVPYKDKFFGDSKKFMEYYKTKFTRPVAYHTAGAAACIETYILAMQAAKSIKAEAVRDALAVADYETFYSRIKFTPDGDGDAIIMGSMIGQVMKGKLEIVFPGEAHSATAIYPAPPWDKKA